MKNNELFGALGIDQSMITDDVKKLLELIDKNMESKGLTYDGFVQDLISALMEESDKNDSSTQEGIDIIVGKVYEKLKEKYGSEEK